MKILSIFGTRPEAIKMAPLIKLLEKEQAIISKVCVTAQHREMLDSVLNIFSITPDYDLDIMTDKQSLSDISSKILQGLESVINSYKPDLILVHDDTTTTLSASLSAFYHKIPLGHIEAGLRTYNLSSPWPEEGNRQITSILSSYHFAPTSTSAKQLKQEMQNREHIYVTGNTVIDALFLAKKIIDNNQNIRNSIEQQFSKIDFSKKTVLITGHRRENFGKGFENICLAIRKLALTFPDVNFVYPLHLNPQVRSIVRKMLSNFDNIKLIEPVEYISFIWLMSKSTLILTDSGGIQEEAPSLGVPVLVMRDTTERPEAVQAGTVKLVGTCSDSIFNNTSQLLTNETAYLNMSQATNPYGDGQASQKIIQHIKNIFNIQLIKKQEISF